jgi:hypothetical protein
VFDRAGFDLLAVLRPAEPFSRKLTHKTIAVWPRSEFVRAAVLLSQRKHVAVVGVSLCATVRGHVNLGYPLIQYRYVQVLPAIQNISASFDPIDAIGTAQAGFRRKRGYFPGKKRSFGFLDFITDPESRETRTSLRLRSSKVDML